MEKTRVEYMDVPGESQYIPKTDKEIKEIALGLRAGSVFGSWQLRDHDKHMLGMVFMPLFFMNSIQRKCLIRDKIVHFYEFVSEAGPRGVNGMPSFFSMRMLDQTDTDRLSAELKKIAEYMGDE